MAQPIAGERARKRGERPPGGMPAGRPRWASERRLYGEPKRAAMPPRAASTREVVAVLDSGEAIEAALADLQSNGFDPSQISLLASRSAVEQLSPAADAAALPMASADSRSAMGPAMAGMIAASKAALAGGPLAGIGVTALPAAAGADAVGALLAKLLPARMAGQFQEQIERGGVLVWVSLPHPEREATAREILARHAGETRAYDIAV